MLQFRVPSIEFPTYAKKVVLCVSMSKLVELDDQNEGFKNMALEARKKVKENKNIEAQKSTDKTVENVSLSTTGGESESVKDSKSHDLVHDKEGKLTMLRTTKIILPAKEKQKEKKKDENGEKGSKEGKIIMLQTEKTIEPAKEKEKEKKNDKNDEKGNKKDKEKKEEKKKKKKKKNKDVDTTSSSSSSSDEDIDDKKNKSSIPWHEYLQLPTSKPWILLGVLGMSILVLVGGAAKMMKRPREEGDHKTTKERMNSSSTDDQLKLCPSCYHNHKNTLVKKS